jgi:endonuclease YncB( thermonuclease family)
MDLTTYNSYLVSGLQSCEKANTPEFTFENGLTKLVKVIDVYDGDTITVAMNIQPSESMNIVYMPSMIYQFRVRMYGYNTEEIRQPKDEPDREEKKARAIQQRDWVSNHILGKMVLLECLGYDKYGRILGKVYLDNEKTECINDIIVSTGNAIAYIP